MKRTATELGKILAEMYNNAKRKEMVTMIHLFGIQYHSEIQEVGIREIIDAAGIPSTYSTEVNKGVNLAKYAFPRQLPKA